MHPSVPSTDDPGQEGNWWTRPCGGIEVLRLALPLVISTGSLSLLLFVDRMLLMWYDPRAIGGSFPASALHWTLVGFPLGVAMYVNTFVAQYYGAKRYERIGAILSQGVWLGVAVVPLFLLLIPFAAPIFHLFRHDAEVIPYEAAYFRVLALGAGATVIGAAQSAFYTGRGVTWVVMLVDVSMVALNIALDMVLIFGVAGWLRWGITGAALATVICQWLKVAAYGWLIRRPQNRVTYGVTGAYRIDLALMRRLLRFGGPSGLQFLLESAGFTSIVMCMGQLDKNSLVATTMAFQINVLAFVPLIGVGIAVSTLVGQQLTGGRADLATRATWTSFWISFWYSCVFAVAYFAFPGVFLLGHAAGAEAAQFGEVRGLATVLLRFVAAYCIFDAVQIVFSCAIKGAGDTRFVLATTAVVSLLSVVVGQVGAYLGGGLYWWWLVVTGWIVVLGVVYLARFLQGKWKRMRVIEPDPTELELNELVEPEPQLAVADATEG